MKQVSWIVLFYLSKTSTIRSILSNAGKLDHACFSCRLDSCNSLIPNISEKKAPVDPKCWMQTGVSIRDHNSPYRLILVSCLLNSGLAIKLHLLVKSRRFRS